MLILTLLQSSLVIVIVLSQQLHVMCAQYARHSDCLKKKKKKGEKIHTTLCLLVRSSKRIYSLIVHSFQGFVHYFRASAETKTSSTNVIKKIDSS